MLNNYAAFLGLDPEPLLLKFADGLQAQLTEKQAVRSVDSPTRPRPEPVMPTPMRRLFASDALRGTALIMLLIVFMGWGVIRILTTRSDTPPSPTAPSIAEVLLISPSPSPSATLIPLTPTRPAPAFIPPTEAPEAGGPAGSRPGPGKGHGRPHAE